MSLKTIVSASLVALGLFAFVAPQPLLAATAPDMKSLDPDADGTVSLAEAQAAGTKKFTTADVDHDGTIDSKEAGMSVSAVDSDKDGTLDAKEYAAAIDASFKKADTDGDGTLDAKELASPAGADVVALTQ